MDKLLFIIISTSWNVWIFHTSGIFRANVLRSMVNVPFIYYVLKTIFANLKVQKKLHSSLETNWNEICKIQQFRILWRV